MTLLLLPGLDGTGTLLTELAVELSRRGCPARVVGYPAREPLSLDALVARVLSDLPPGPWAVLGESFSGPIALGVARARPRGLRAVILAASFVSPPLRFGLDWAALAAVALPPPSLGVRALLLGFDAEPARVRELQAALGEVRWSVLARRLRELARLDARADLQACPYPLLYLGARRDRLLPRAAREEVVALRPDLRLEILDGPHLLLQRAPGPAATRIVAFLREVAPDVLAGDPHGRPPRDPGAPQA